MIFYPKAYFNQIEDITVEYLKANNIKGLILDVDNTLIDKKKFMRDTTKKWAEGIKNAGIKMCILSNSSNKTKVDKIAKEIDINYSYFATKPLKRGLENIILKKYHKTKKDS